MLTILLSPYLLAAVSKTHGHYTPHVIDYVVNVIDNVINLIDYVMDMTDATFIAHLVVACYSK